MQRCKNYAEFELLSLKLFFIIFHTGLTTLASEERLLLVRFIVFILQKNAADTEFLQPGGRFDGELFVPLLTVGI